MRFAILAATLVLAAFQGCDDGDGEDDELFYDHDGDGLCGDGVDFNHDGYCDENERFFPGGDCDDSDPDVYRGNDERCDNIDNDCDGYVDNGIEDDSCTCNCPELRTFPLPCLNGEWRVCNCDLFCEQDG